MARLVHRLKKTLAYLYHTSMRAHGKPRQIALGMALGVFAGLLPYAISQTLLALALAAIFRANKVSAAAGTWISNPATSLPLYFAGYAIGAVILGDPVLPYDVLHKGFEEANSLADAVKIIFSTLGMPILLGTAILGAILGIVAYFITYQMVIAYRIRKNQRRMQRQHVWMWSQGEGWHRAPNPNRKA